MISLTDLNRKLKPIRNRILLLIGRGILKNVNNDTNTQTVDISVMAGEEITEVERFQEYGMETYPIADSEILSLFIGGMRSRGIVIKTHDRRYRPKDLQEGDIQVYTSTNSGSPHRIWMKKDDRNIQIDCEILIINITETQHTGDMIIKGNLSVEGDISSTQNITDSVRSMASDRSIYNSHLHSNPEGGNVGPANPTQ